jgi:hypothetical protein
MTPVISRTTFVFAVALLVPCIAAIWLLLEPKFLSGSTYAMFAATLIATAAIAINAWKNGQATTSTSQVIYEAEIGSRTR